MNASINLPKLLCIIAAWVICLGAIAQNPLVTHMYTADPTARVYDGKLYVYPSTDVDDCGPNQGTNGFCMPSYNVFSTTDLVNWTDHGTVIDQNDVPWGKKNSYGMWAPDCIRKNGTYYYYFPGPPADNSAFRRIGVATSSSPTGPFRLEPNYMAGLSGIDPGLFLDSDNTGYLYYAQGGNLKAVRLKANMKEISGQPVAINNMPVGYKEGPFTFKRGNLYYLTFAHVGPNNYEIGYATSTNPLGPFQYRGTALRNIGIGTIHGSFVAYKNKWYVFYHYWSLSGNQKRRSMRADEITFNNDGTFVTKTATIRGVGTPKSGDVIQMDRGNAFSRTKVDKIQGQSEPAGWQINYIENNGWARFDRVNFGAGQLTSLTARVASPFTGGKIEFRIGNPSGQLLGVVDVPNTGSWNSWQTVSANVTANISGVKNLVTVFKGSAPQYLFNLNWVKFTSSGGDGGGNQDIPYGRTIKLSAHNGQYVAIGPNEGNSPLRANNGEFQQFEVVNAGNGYVALRAQNGKLVSARLDETGMPLRASRAGVFDIWERFQWASLPNGQCALTAHNGLYVSARLNEGGLPVRASGTSLDIWEKFTFELVDGARDAIRETTVGKGIAIYPNPAKSRLNVEGLKVGDQLTLFDQYGKQVFTKMATQSGEAMHIEGMPGGVYFLKVNDKIPMKFVKQ